MMYSSSFCLSIFSVRGDGLEYFFCIQVLFPMSICFLPIFIPCLNYYQFTMELAGVESGNIPKCYSMDMSTDFIPMSVFSESAQGECIFYLIKKKIQRTV